MFYCGLDLHAKSSAFCLMNRRGNIVAEGEVPSSRSGFERILRAAKGEEVRVVLESSTPARAHAARLRQLKRRPR